MYVCTYVRTYVCMYIYICIFGAFLMMLSLFCRLSRLFWIRSQLFGGWSETSDERRSFGSETWDNGYATGHQSAATPNHPDISCENGLWFANSKVLCGWYAPCYCRGHVAFDWRSFFLESQTEWRKPTLFCFQRQPQPWTTCLSYGDL